MSTSDDDDDDDGLETCVRCQRPGTDRRTLQMSCGYRMDEGRRDLRDQPPYKSAVLFYADPATLTEARPPGKITLEDGTSLNLTPGTVTSSGELYPEGLYTLRVCKSCRADWMEAQHRWYTDGARMAAMLRESDGD